MDINNSPSKFVESIKMGNNAMTRFIFSQGNVTQHEISQATIFFDENKLSGLWLYQLVNGLLNSDKYGYAKML